MTDEHLIVDCRPTKNMASFASTNSLVLSISSFISMEKATPNYMVRARTSLAAQGINGQHLCLDSMLNERV